LGGQGAADHLETLQPGSRRHLSANCRSYDEEMTSVKPNKHQLKTQETRELLLRAAQEIFVRDGYSGAELGEIAATAGRTKGAIYAQFESKEDIFMALVEDYALRNRSEMVKALANSSGVEQNREVFKKLCMKMSGDRTWNILMLEFKLFAIRNPEAKKRYQRFMSTMIAPGDEKRLTHLLGAERKGEHALSRSLSVQLIQPLLSAIALEALFDPEVLTEDAGKKVAGRLFDALFEAPGSVESVDSSRRSRQRAEPEKVNHHKR
jgi:AcrR family transcriptional regulator